MSMIKCPECGKEISDKASACPNCGYPLTAEDKNETVSPPIPTTIPVKKKKKRGCLTSIIVFLFFIFIVGTAIGNSTSFQGKNQKTSEETTEEAVLTKDEAKALDEQIWSYVLPVINANNQLMKAMAAYSEGSISQLDLYNITKDFKDYAQNAWSAAPDVTDDGAKQYLESCRDYIIVEQTMAESLLKYLDSLKTSDLSKVQENIERCNQALGNVASNKGVFLSLNGFSDEEIEEISNNLGIEE